MSQIYIEFNVENEDTSEDEIGSYINDGASEYDRMITEYDESDEESDNDHEYDSDEESEESDEDVIIDKSFSNEQMPQACGEFAPYFKNFTESLFFCWMKKHQNNELLEGLINSL